MKGAAGEAGKGKKTVDAPLDARAFGRLVPSLVGLVVAGLAFLLYLATLAPDVLYYERPALIDSAMFQAQAYVLGIPHPSGYPTYTMLAHLFAYLPFGDGPAYRVNLASAVFGALAVFLVFLVGLRLSGGRPLAAAVGAATFGAGETFWSQAVIAEVYTLNALFIALILLLLLLWRNARRDRYLLAAAFFVGLSLTNHITSGLLIPAALLFVRATDRGKLQDRRLMLRAAGLLTLGLLPYLYLPVRALSGVSMREADPTGPLSFLAFVGGREYAGQLVSLGPGDIPARLALFGGYLLDEFHPLLLVVAALGFFVVYKKDRAGALLLGFLFVGWLVHALQYDIFDFYLYFVPPYLILALLVCAGAGALVGWAARLLATRPPLYRAAAPLLLAVPLLYLAVSGAGGDYESVDRSRDTEGRRILEVVAEKTAPGATVLHHRGPLWYMVLVEGRRRDLTLVSAWYPSRNPTRSWSDPSEGRNVRVPYADSISNEGTAEARAAAESGPVYALRGSVDLCRFRQAGFEIVPVEEDTLYEVVPPDATPYTTPEERRGKTLRLGCGVRR